MMLCFVPAWNGPTVTTAFVPGGSLRLTIVCSDITISEAITIGSTVFCGQAPWPPFPVTTRSRLSVLADANPGQTPTVPAWPGKSCTERQADGGTGIAFLNLGSS